MHFHTCQHQLSVNWRQSSSLNLMPRLELFVSWILNIILMFFLVSGFHYWFNLCPCNLFFLAWRFCSFLCLPLEVEDFLPIFLTTFQTRSTQKRFHSNCCVAMKNYHPQVFCFFPSSSVPSISFGIKKAKQSFIASTFFVAWSHSVPGKTLSLKYWSNFHSLEMLFHPLKMHKLMKLHFSCFPLSIRLQEISIQFSFSLVCKFLPLISNSICLSLPLVLTPNREQPTVKYPLSLQLNASTHHGSFSISLRTMDVNLHLP